VATALNCDQVSDIYVAEAEKARAARMNVIRAGKLGHAAFAVLHVRKPHGQSQMDQLVCRSANYRRAVRSRLDWFLVHNLLLTKCDLTRR
jgi:hypothetical protein